MKEKVDNELSTSRGNKATMQSEMSRARYVSSRGENFLNYRVVTATKVIGYAIRVGIVFQEYLVGMKRIYCRSDAVTRTIGKQGDARGSSHNQPPLLN